jgi:putative ABC transport system substrate-binding protein
VPVIGFLHQASSGPNAPQVASFLLGLREIGYIDGQNVTIRFMWAEGRYDQLPAMAGDLVGRGVSVIAVALLPAALAAKAATNSIPIVFVTGSDALDVGLIDSLSRPSGNLTGVNMLTTALNAKRLEVLREFVPAARLVGVLVNPDNPNTDSVLAEVDSAARNLGQKILVTRAANEAEFVPAFEFLRREKIDALLVGNDGVFSSKRDQIAELAARYKVPAIYSSRSLNGDDGALISYGASQSESFHQAGLYVGRILKGAKPADLPVVQPTKFELMINLKTAKSLGLAVPPQLLARADEVIE